MKYKTFFQNTLVARFAFTFILSGLIFSFVQISYAQIFERDINLVRDPGVTGAEVGSEIIEGHEQVYYIQSGEKKFITEGSQNSSQAVSDGDYISYSKVVNGAGQIFLHYIPNNTTIQITSTSTNLQPRLSEGKIVWERWTENTWQVFLYDGVAARQLTSGDLSISPDISGDQVVYASFNERDDWRTFVYSLKSKQTRSVKSGLNARYPKFRNGQVVFVLEELLARREARRLAREEAERFAMEVRRLAEEARIAEEALIEPLPDEEPVLEEEPEPEPEEPVIPGEVPLFAILHVIKLVVNGALGTSTDAEFNLHVTIDDGDVLGSPLAGAGPPGTSYNLTPGTYAVSEDPVSAYEQIFSGDCDISGNITLIAGDEKFCTIVNTDIPPPTEEPPTEEVIRVSPVIDVLMHQTPSETPETPDAPHLFTHNYTVWMVSGDVPLIDISMTDDSCTPLEYLSGDTNADGKLDLGENWLYQCSVFISETTTNTVTGVGYTDDELHEATIASSVNTTVVVDPLAPALPETGFISDLFRNRRTPTINIIKVPDILDATPSGQRGVSYKYVVSNQGQDSLSDVEVHDNACAPVILNENEEANGGILVPGDSWIYTCKTSVPETTRNVTMVTGKANGQIAVGYAFSSIFVYSFTSFNKILLILLSVLLLSLGAYIAYIIKKISKIDEMYDV